MTVVYASTPPSRFVYMKNRYAVVPITPPLTLTANNNTTNKTKTNNTEINK
eukprot:gene8949-6279_t